MPKSQKSALYAGVSFFAVCALAVTASAIAQTTPAAPAATTTSSTATDNTVVVVTARRKALQSATERKKNSDTIIDSVVADEAGKLPDTSITEVLSRVAGVSMVRFASVSSPDQFSWEGSGIQIRGLSGVTGLLNGREVFSANGGGGLNWGDVTPEMMAAVDVYKASDAHLIEGGIGGAIDLRTKMPFDYKKPEIDVSLSDSYGDLIKKSSPSESVLLTNTWNTGAGPVGLLVDVARDEFQSGDSFMRTEPYYKETSGGTTHYVPGGFDYGNDEFDRTRTGFYEALQWKPADNLTIWQTAFASNYKTKNGGGGVFADVSFAQPYASNATYDSNGVFKSGTLATDGSNSTTTNTWSPGSANNYTPGNNTTSDFSQGFTWKPSDTLKIDGAFQYVDSWTDAQDYGMGVGTGINLTTETMNLSGSGLPTNTITNAANLMTTAATAAPTSIIWNEGKNHAHMSAVNLDFDQILGDGFFKEAKFGGRYADRAETDSFTGTWWSAINESWDGQQKTVAQSPAGDWAVYDFPNFFKGKIAVPGNYIFSTQQVICPTCLTHDVTTYGAGEGYSSATTMASFGAPQVTTTRIQTIDLYGEVKFGSDTSWFGVPMTGNAGVRVVQDKVAANGTFSEGSTGDFYANTADANTSLADVGGSDAAAQAWILAHPHQSLPLTYSLLTAIPHSIHGNIGYTRALPSINFNFKPSDVVIVRLAVNQTLSPPSYSDDKVGGSIGPVTVPNPNGQGLPSVWTGTYSSTITTELKPEVSTNEDLSVEWYPSQALNAHFDVFNKDIKDFIVYNQNVTPGSEPYLQVGAASPTSLPGQVITVQDYNSPKKSTVDGLELGAREFFDMLPGAFSGLGVEANYTLISSKSPSTKAYGMDGIPITGLPIPGLSTNNFNINLLYDKGAWDARLAYSWRSDYLATTTGNGTNSSYSLAGAPSIYGCSANTVCYSLPVYANAFGQMDGSVSYTVNDNVKISFQATNILDGIPRTKMEILPGVFETRSWYLSDRRYEVAVRLKY